MKQSVGFLISFSILLAGPLMAQCPSADLTGDCFVDFADFAALSRWWLDECDPNSECLNADLFLSGSVDIDDLAVMISAWQTGIVLPDDMVYIPYGTFQMGDSFDEGWSGERPVHDVTLSSFSIGRYEVTNGQYRDFLQSALSSGTITVSDGIVYGTDNNHSYCDTSSSDSYSQIAFDGTEFSVRTKAGRNMNNDPMVRVSWYGAAAYCNWRSEQEERQPCYNLATGICDFSKNGYHLATEAQWEYAARGGLAGQRFPWGDTINHDYANYRANSSAYSYDTTPYTTWTYYPASNDGIYPYTSPTANAIPNGYGLYDMAGNVWEWCNDRYANYSPDAQTNPTGEATGTDRVLRGGAWNSNAYESRTAHRYGLEPEGRIGMAGFRVAINLE
ncbi:MAG: formylglycine-generating enzyme family protein [Sedimentisphaerales bacterium]|nr:formylglycine-generating enzyme family protein [Sedimentisphaerales bacterium]